MQHYSLTICAG